MGGPDRSSGEGSGDRGRGGWVEETVGAGEGLRGPGRRRRQDEVGPSRARGSSPHEGSDEGTDYTNSFIPTASELPSVDNVYPYLRT